MTRARALVGLAERFGVLPGEVEDADADLLGLVWVADTADRGEGRVRELMGGAA